MIRSRTRWFLLSFTVTAMLSGCIGTDIIDDAADLPPTITPPADPSLKVGDTLRLTVQVTRPIGNDDEVTLFWNSSRPEVLTVDNTGLVTALAEGTAEVTAAANGVESAPLLLAVGEEEEEAPPPPVATDAAREGTLMGQGGYTAEGTVTLSQDDTGNVILTTSDDFNVSFAAGTFLYLSNSEDGRQTATTGLEVADVSESTTGAQTFNVTEVDASVALDTYRYVVVLCKPFSLTFGTAELN